MAESLKKHPILKRIATLEGPGGRVREITLAGDRGLVASGHESGINLWNLAPDNVPGPDGVIRPVRTMTGPGRANRLGVSPDGRFAITAQGSANSSASLGLWDLEQGVWAGALKSFQRGWIDHLALSPGNRIAISGGAGGNLLIWNLESGKTPEPLPGRRDPIILVEFLGDSSQALTLDQSGALVLWDLKERSPIKEQAIGLGPICTARLGEDKETLLINSQEGTSALVRLSSDLAPRVIREFPAGRHLSGLSRRGDLVVFYHQGGELRLWIRDGGTVSGIPCPFDSAQGLEMDQQGKWVALAVGGWLHIYDLGSKDWVEPIRISERRVNDLKFIPGSGRIAAISGDQALRVIDPGTGERIHTLAGPALGLWSLDLTADGSRVVSSSYSEGDQAPVVVWDLVEERYQDEFRGLANWVRRVRLDPEGERAYLASYDPSIEVWKIDPPEKVAALKNHTSYVNDLAITPDGRRMLSGGGNVQDYDLRLWSLVSLELLARLRGHTASVLKISLSPSGRRAISGDKEGGLIHWDLVERRKIAELKGHRSAILAADFLMERGFALSGGEDGRLILWDLDKKEGRVIHEFDSFLGAIQILPDGSRVMVADESGQILLYELLWPEGRPKVHPGQGVLRVVK